jgi:hypothetical protein
MIQQGADLLNLSDSFLDEFDVIALPDGLPFLLIAQIHRILGLVFRLELYEPLPQERLALLQVIHELLPCLLAK